MIIFIMRWTPNPNLPLPGVCIPSEPRCITTAHLLQTSDKVIVSNSQTKHLFNFPQFLTPDPHVLGIFCYLRLISCSQIFCYLLVFDRWPIFLNGSFLFLTFLWSWGIISKCNFGHIVCGLNTNTLVDGLKRAIEVKKDQSGSLWPSWPCSNLFWFMHVQWLNFGLQT